MGEVVDNGVGEGGLASIEEVVVAGVQNQEGTVSVVGEVASKVESSVSSFISARQNLHHTRYTCRPWMEVVAASPVVVREGTRGERVSSHLEVFGLTDDRAGQDKSQGEAVAVAVVGIRTDPE